MRIADTFQIKSRFMRSVHLERDFYDESALEGYVLTPHTQSGLERLARGLLPRSGQRAWRVTGDYGTGKSSFALALSHLLSGSEEGIPDSLRSAIDFPGMGLDEPPRLLPVLTTGSREPLVTAILRSLGDAIERSCFRGKRPGILARIREATSLLPLVTPGDAQAITLIREAVAYVVQSGKGSGVLIVLDELGKFLEYAALYPERQDIYFLQILAETASRSGEEPILVVGLLHQGFNSYADQLSQAAQKEWEKVAGRFEELLFNQPLEQMANLVADALNVRAALLPAKLRGRVKEDMARTLDLGWYGAGAGRRSLTDLAPQLYPLHPSVLPVLVQLLSRFGQNERSLFSFLLSDEPFSLREFSERSLESKEFYRLHDLYDYVRAAFGHRLSVQSYRSHWNQIESVIESFPLTRDHEFELRILKTIAVLNLLDQPGLIASSAAIAIAVECGNTDTGSPKRTLQKLQKDRSVLYDRGIVGGYCLWPHTSVNLERAYQEASKAIPTYQRVASLIRDDLETRPLVARRHYIETGNLRHFEVLYTPVNELLPVVTVPPKEADGRIVIALCETEQERKEALSVAGSLEHKEREELLIAVPSPLQSLSKLIQEVQRWEWVSENVPELNNDSYAAEEVSRQLVAARQVLVRRVRSYVGLRQYVEPVELQWFHRGQPLSIADSRTLLSKLSEICDRIYEQAPRIRNELVNRHDLSSAASAARQRLIERILEHASAPLLGMDEKGKPPEMSMYLSVLKRAALHRKTLDGWEIAEPSMDDDPCRVRPVLARIHDILVAAQDSRVRVSDLFEQLRRPPYGIREGLAPLLLSIFAVIHEQDLAFYDKGAFLLDVTGHEFQRLVKAPADFEVQYCRVSGLRAALFDRLVRLLGTERLESKQTDIMDVVRPLCVFAAQLPAYTHRTSMLTAEAKAVKDVLLNAEDPVSLLFTGLPKACGIGPFALDERPSPQRITRFVDRLKGNLDELRGAYPSLVERIKSDLLQSFDRPGGFEAAREGIAATAEQLLVVVADARLKAFCLRLADRRLGEQEWLESLASLLCAKPPAKWVDADHPRFREELNQRVQQFRRVESATFDVPSHCGMMQVALRVAITSRDGSEVDQVVYLDADEEPRVAELEATIAQLLGAEGRLGMVAATRAIWSRLRNSPARDGRPPR